MLNKYLKISSIIAFVLFTVGLIGFWVLDGFDNDNTDLIFSIAEVHTFDDFEQKDNYHFEVDENIKLTSEAHTSEIRIEKSDAEKVEIVAEYSNLDEKYIVKQDGDAITIDRKKEERVLGIKLFPTNRGGLVTVKIPSEVISDIKITTTNGNVIIADQQIETLNVNTSNSSVTLNNTNVKNDITVKTSNDVIDLQDVTANNIILDTSNGKINVTDIETNKLSMYTHNQSIYTDNIHATDITVKTSNSKVHMKETYGDSLDVKTSNESVVCDNVYVSDVKVVTSNNDIDITNKDMEYEIQSLETKTSNGNENITANYKKND